MYDTKPQVKDAATKSMHTACNTVQNKDIVGFIPEIIGSIINPEQTCVPLVV